MSIEHLATFTLCGHVYGLPVDRVQEVLKGEISTPVPLAPGIVRGLMNLRGEIVLVVDLRARLALPERGAGEAPMSVVVRVGGEVISLLVDRIHDVVDVDHALFEAPLDTLTGPARDVVRGAYKLPDRLLLELDVDRTVALATAS